jgi:hypothetical protein
MAAEPSLERGAASASNTPRQGCPSGTGRVSVVSRDDNEEAATVGGAEAAGGIDQSGLKDMLTMMEGQLGRYLIFKAYISQCYTLLCALLFYYERNQSIMHYAIFILLLKQFSALFLVNTFHTCLLQIE